MSSTDLIKIRSLSEIIKETLPPNYKIFKITYIDEMHLKRSTCVITNKPEKEIRQICSKGPESAYFLTRKTSEIQIEEVPEYFNISGGWRLDTLISWSCPEHRNMLEICKIDYDIEKRTVELYNLYIAEAKKYSMNSTRDIKISGTTVAIFLFGLSCLLFSCAASAQEFYTAFGIFTLSGSVLLLIGFLSLERDNT